MRFLSQWITTLDVMTSAATLNPSSWARPRPEWQELRGDVGLAIGLAFAATTTTLLYNRAGLLDEPAPVWVWVIALGLTTLPLALRRRYPVPVAVVVSIGFFITGEFAVPEALITNIALFIALYTVGAWESNRALAAWSRLLIALATIVWLVLSLLFAVDSAELFPGLSRSGLFSAYATFAVLQIITNLLYFGGAYYFGERSWRGARDQAQLEAQGQVLDLERRTSAAQAVTLDRIAIARELHDVVAHHVSVMGIQAAAARRSLEKNPALAAEALETIESSASTAIDELRQLLHTLRSPEAEISDGSSTVGLAQVGTLVTESQRAGTETSLIVAGEARPIPMLVDVALFRVIQEALTNVRKHAGRGAEAEVRLRFAPESVEVEVSDNGVLQTFSHSSEGLGLRGMRERIGAVGGTLSVGRRERGGFLVRAAVPLAHSVAAGSKLETRA